MHMCISIDTECACVCVCVCVTVTESVYVNCSPVPSSIGALSRAFKERRCWTSMDWSSFFTASLLNLLKLKSVAADHSANPDLNPAVSTVSVTRSTAVPAGREF